MKLAVIVPSRGLAFSQTCEELLDNLQGLNYEIFFAHGLDIPECYNAPLKRALRGPYTHFWIVEDDMILPKGVLKELLRANVQAICCDYPVSKQGKAAVYRDPAGDVIYGGVGCLLMTKKFLKKYKQPIFRTDVVWDVKIGERFEATPRKIRGDLYGLHDVTFGLLACGRGEPIKLSKITCGQRKLIALGQSGTNNGEHWVETWTDLKPETLTITGSNYVTAMLHDGTPVLMSAERAKQLAKQNKVVLLPDSYVELMNNEVLEELL